MRRGRLLKTYPRGKTKYELILEKAGEGRVEGVIITGIPVKTEKNECFPPHVFLYLEQWLRAQTLRHERRWISTGLVKYNNIII